MSSAEYRFSSRQEWDLRPNRISKLIREKTAAGAEILDLTESNPTKAGFVHQEAEVLHAIADPAALVYRPEARGLRCAREAVAAYHGAAAAGTGGDVDPDQIVLTASTSEAYSFLFKLLGDPGDEILVPRPSYPLFEFLVGLEQLEVRHYPLVWDKIWHMDLDAVDDLISERTKAIVVVNPNNPTGSYLKRAERGRLATVCAERRIALISDEVFFDFALEPGTERISTASGAEDALSFTLSGLSKVVGLPQMKLGWIVVAGPEEVRGPALEGLELIADTYLSVGSPVQHGAARLLAMRQGFRAKVTERTGANLTHLREATAKGLLAPLNVEGGWYTILRLPPGVDEESLVLNLLAEDDVLAQPGYFYEFPFPCLVLSLLTPVDTFQEGVQRLTARSSSWREVDI